MRKMNMNNSNQSEYWKTITAFVFGAVFLVTLLVLAVAFPNPTAFQYTIFRIVLALSAAGVAGIISGFLEVQMKQHLQAGGAMAVFVVVYFFSPAQLFVSEFHSPPSEEITVRMSDVDDRAELYINDKLSYKAQYGYLRL
jgi:hypothetical protein